MPATLALLLPHLPVLAGLGLLAALGTRAVIALGIVDEPNHRSAHGEPTPKSAGLAVMASFIIGLGAIQLLVPGAQLRTEVFAVYLGLILFLTAVSLVDDLRGLSAPAKLAAQAAAALAFTALIGRFDVIELPVIGNLELGVLGWAITILWIVGCMNVFNFMDGLNGMLGLGCVLGLAGLSWFAIHTGVPFVALAALTLLAAVVGFLPFNFPHARVFLGETGSQMLGFLIATLAVIGSRAEHGQLSIYVTPVLFMPYLAEIAVGLASRMARGHHPFHGHREFPFHLLHRLGFSHARVTLIYAGLFLMAFLAALGVDALPRGWRPFGAILAVMPFALFSLAILRVGARQGLLADER